MVQYCRQADIIADFERVVYQMTLGKIDLGENHDRILAEIEGLVLVGTEAMVFLELLAEREDWKSTESTESTACWYWGLGIVENIADDCY